ncbi:NOL1/NOP2/sun family putative RNA met [Xylona heveae TC161]|uniref:Nucleolar protein 2 n=1 Tax=Xylona heveae (strain CBS 132557 / TC161) TaxID=1328760 RepID=A0A165AJB9_XYLHT|nr:NOL1/NOP2/sun family putative RNA met [Xylona heveae TC161]KZF20574.1 NOL1/NOP2/sun family putative RNA met [Xylona heveae TC161]
MGVGRRMKKQGAPAALGEAHFAALKKRKAGGEVTFDDEGKAPKQDKKRKTTTQEKEKPAKKQVKETVKEKPNGIEVNAVTKKPNGKVAAKAKVEAAAPATKKPSKKAPIPMDDDEEDESDIPDDEFEDLDDLEDEDGDEPMGDDFMGESDEGSEVYDSDEAHEKAMFSEDEDVSDAEERLTAANIAGLSRKLDEQKAIEDAEAQAELEEAALQTNIAGDRPKVLPGEDDEEVDQSTLLAPDLQLLRTRITDNVRVLDDFHNLAEEGRSRAEYVAQLLKDICAYYGYSPYLAEKLFNLFPPREAFAFFEANETSRPIVIRTNTLRTHRRELAQTLINRGVTLEPVGKWSKVGLQVFESQVPLGATPEYLAGHYILQAASSFLPVMALAPQEHERVLDMASAPGGKTTHMSALMKNTGVIFANDSNKSRSKGLIGNIHRLGCKNTIVCNYDAREFPKVMGGFDRVLLDAPCSGTGVIAKDASIKTNKSERDFMQLPHLQKQLILCAIDSVDHASKTGGYLVYSTCSVTVEENEAVVQYALQKRPNVKLVETGLTFGVPGFTAYMGKKFDSKLKMTRRFYPHAYNVDGFFVAKFKKTGPSTNTTTKDKPDTQAVQNGEEMDVDNKTPIMTEDEEERAAAGGADFGGFDENEDEAYIEKATRRRLRKKGLDPKGVLNKPKADKQEKSDETNGAASKETTAESSPKPAAKSDKADKKQAKQQKSEAKTQPETEKKAQAEIKSASKPEKGEKVVSQQRSKTVTTDAPTAVAKAKSKAKSKTKTKA